MVKYFNLEQLLPLNQVEYGYGHLKKTYRIKNKLENEKAAQLLSKKSSSNLPLTFFL